MTTIAPTKNSKLSTEQLLYLSPEIRERLLTFTANWQEPLAQTELVDALREAHGSLLFLLDYQADALVQLGKYKAALEVIERRQRRSTTIASQIMEAKALLAAGHEDHAQAVVDDISQAYPRNIVAIGAAAEVYTKLGRLDHAVELLEAYLQYRPADLEATLIMADIALESGDKERASEYVQRLGSGIPARISTLQLKRMGHLFEGLGNAESANAVELELSKRQQDESEKLEELLAPYGVIIDGKPTDTLLETYRALSSPENIEVTKKEERTIQLEAVRHFGFMKLRFGQTQAIATVLRGESILAVMPTGAGKSLCYQLPALTMPRATLVISPLIALMKDQVESLPAAARAQATFINSSLEDDELEARMSGIAQGKYKLIYAAPERLRQRGFLRALRSAGLDFFVVDEAHCVSLWGHDFRPDYLFIQEARRELGNPVALAMTATAPPAVRDEIVDYMGVDEYNLNDKNGTNGSADIALDTDEEGTKRPRVMTLDIFRNNLHLSALKFNSDEEKLGALTKFVTDTKGSGIVYVNSRAKSEALAFELRQHEVTAEAYHAGLTDRGAVQDRFMANKTRVVVATVAFGMGIDKPDIRFIAHFHPSRSLAAYYQEVGRAGRDDKPSQGVLFYSNNDWANLRRWAKSDEFSTEFLEKMYAAVAMQLGVKQAENASNNSESDNTEEDDAKSDDESIAPEGLSLESLSLEESVIGIVDPRRLQQVMNTDETTMRVAVSTLERAELLSRSFDLPRELEITLSKKMPKKIQPDPGFLQLLKGLALKTGSKATFKTNDVANFMKWQPHETEARLLDWQADGFLTVKGSRRAMLIELTAPSAAASSSASVTQNSIAAELRERLERLISQSAAIAQRRIDDIVGYATAETCRHGYISAHFGSPPLSKCEVCDNCTGIKPDIPVPTESNIPLPDDADLEPMILDCLVSLPKPVGRSGLARILAGSLRSPVQPDKARHFSRLKGMGEAMIMNYIDGMLEDNRLRQYERQGYPVLAATVRGRAEAEVWLEENPDKATFGDAPEATVEEVKEEAAEGDKYTTLQKALWLWRRRTAESMGQPPYVIMSNDAMLRVAELRPQDIESLATIPGMGKQRLEGYGPQILDLVQLNAAEDGDADLLTSQREDQANTEKKVKGKVAAGTAGAVVSKRSERRIFMKMQEFRQKRAVGEGLSPYHIAANGILKALAQTGPTSQADLNKIVGFRSCGLKDDADKILEFITAELADES